MSVAIDRTEQNLELDVGAEPLEGQYRGKIAYLVNQYPLASSTFIRREIEAMERLGFEVLRFSVRQSRTKLSDPKDLVEASKTRLILEMGAVGLVIAALTTAIKRPIGFFRALWLTTKTWWHSDSGIIRHIVYFGEACQLCDWLIADRVSHVHSHYGTNSTTVAMLTHAMGGPEFSFTSHGPEEFDKPQLLRLGEKVARSKFAIAISEYGRSQLYRWTSHQHWSKIHVVHCGLDREFLQTPLTPPSADRRLVFIGRLSEQKGTHVLIEAANRLKADGVQFELVLVGDGPFRGELERLISRYGLDDHVILAGWKTDAEVRQALTTSRALVMASFAEGLPVVIMESLAMGRPVVSTNVAGVAELVHPGVNGWLVPAGAVGPLADTMRDVLETPVEELAEYGARGAQMVAIRHDAMKEASKLAELIHGEEVASATGLCSSL